MTITVKHNFVSVNGEDPDASLVAEHAWNDAHAVTVDPGLVGRSPEGGSGPASTIAVGSGLVLTGGVLSATGGGSGGGATGPTGPTGPAGPTGPTGPAGGGSGGGLPSGGTTSQVVARDQAGNGIWHRSLETINVEDFYPAGYTTKHDSSSHSLSSIFGSLAAAQAVYPLVDDLLPEVDYCAIQAAIDYAFNQNMRTVVIPEGVYVTGQTIFLDAPNSLRNQSGLAGSRWHAGTTYSQNQVVMYNGVPYLSLQNGNVGHTPFYIVTEVGNDPWWQMYYATAAADFPMSLAALSQVGGWSPTLLGAPGTCASYSVTQTLIRTGRINIIGILVGTGNGNLVRDISVAFPTPAWNQGGANPWGCGFVVIGAGSGASNTILENLSVRDCYTVIKFAGTQGGGLADNNLFRRCSGGGTYRFLSYTNNQAWINSLYDCTPQSIVGIANASGASTIIGGNWSVLGEATFNTTFNVTNISNITTGSGSGTWILGDLTRSIPTATYQFVSMRVTSSLASGSEYQLLTNAFSDFRAGNYNWFVILTPSYGPVPLIGRSATMNREVPILNVFGAITGGSGYVNGTYYNVPMIGGSGSGRVVTVTVAGGAVTALSVVSPGTGYVIGDVLSASTANLGGGSGSGFSVLADQILQLMIAPHWIDAFMDSNFVTNTNVQSELQAATSIIGGQVAFPFQTPVTAIGVFFENAAVPMSLYSSYSPAPSTISGAIIDADPSLGIWNPVNGLFNPLYRAAFYIQKTVPFIWLDSDLVLESIPLNSVDPLIVYTTPPYYARYKVVWRDSYGGGGGTAPKVAFWYSARNGGNPWYGDSIQLSAGAAMENGWEGPPVSIPTWNDGFGGSDAKIWPLQGGQTPTSGVRPSVWTTPTILPSYVPILANPQLLPQVFSLVLDGSRANTKYSLFYGGALHKTDTVSPIVSAKPGTIMFEGSHDLYNYFQTLTDHANGGPGVILGMAWNVRGQSFLINMDVNTITWMFPGLVIGITTDVFRYYVVTSVQPGLGFITVYGLATSGVTYVTGSKATVYSGNVIRMQPYRLKYLAAPPLYSNAAVTAVTGQEIMADTSSAAFVLSLPKAQSDAAAGGVMTLPLQGDKVTWDDIGGAFATHNLIIDGNGSPLNGAMDNLAVTTSAPGMALYKNTSTGWVVTGGTLTAASALLVTPDTNVAFGGQIGGTYYPASVTYNLKASSGTVNYSITGVPAWLTPSSTSGSVTTSGTNVIFTVTPGALAPDPPYAPNIATMTFTNTATGQSTKRNVLLHILGLQYAAEGDSITNGFGAPPGYPSIYASAFSPSTSLNLTLLATTGAGYSQIISRLPQAKQLASIKKSGDKFALSVMTGTNDATFGYPAYGTLNRTDYLQKYAAYLDALRSAGWYVIVCTQISRGGDGNSLNIATINPELIALNTEFKLWTSNGSVVPGAHADAVCDFAANAHFDPTLTSPAAYTNLTYYQADQTHPSATGQTLLESIIAPFIDAALNANLAIGTSAGVATVTGVGIAPFNPTQLFAHGEAGGWWDPSDNTTTFQDTAGTILANANGQVVQLIKDKSGNGRDLVLNPGQTGPTLNTGGGLWWLTFNGTTDTLRVIFSMTTPVSRVSAARAITYVNGAYLWSSGSSQLYQNAPSPQIQMYGTNYGPPDSTHMTVNADHVVLEVWNGTSSSLQVDNNAVNNTNDPAGSFVGVSISGSIGAVSLSNIRWYGAVHIGRLLTTTEMNNSRTFFGAKAGLSL